MNGIHCMLDFETLGQRPSTAVLSLGAVLFERTGIFAQRYWHFDADHQINHHHRTIDFETLSWWLNQNQSAKEVFKKSDVFGANLNPFCVDFIQFCSPYGADLKMWGNGADFDVAILSDILRMCEQPRPWKFWNIRCFRTFNAIYNCKGLVTRKGIHHNALDDAIYQAECVIAALNQVRPP